MSGSRPLIIRLFEALVNIPHQRLRLSSNADTMRVAGGVRREGGWQGPVLGRRLLCPADRLPVRHPTQLDVLSGHVSALVEKGGRS